MRALAGVPALDDSSLATFLGQVLTAMCLVAGLAVVFALLQFVSGLVRSGGLGVLGVDSSGPSAPLPAARSWAQTDRVYEEVLATWCRHREGDLQLRLTHVLLQDLEDPTVAAAALALARADACRASRAPSPPPDIECSAYWQSVTDATCAVKAAIAKAARIGTRQLPQAEAERIAEAQFLLARALDCGNHDAERRLCYERVRRLIDGVLDDPQEALAATAAAAGLVSITADPATQPAQQAHAQP